MKSIIQCAFVCLALIISSSTLSAQQVKSSAHTAFFAYNSSTVSAEGKQMLDNLIPRLKKGTDYEVLIYGYADPSGDSEYNRQLSIRRIQAVNDYLLKMGIPTDNVNMQIPRGEDLVRTKYFKEEPDLSDDERRQVELIVTPKIDIIDPQGATIKE